MQQISYQINNLQVEKKITSERQSLIKEFLDALNEERKGTQYKPLTARVVAIKVAHLNTFELYHFLKVCKQGDSFGKRFFGFLKVK